MACISLAAHVMLWLLFGVGISLVITERHFPLAFILLALSLPLHFVLEALLVSRLANTRMKLACKIVALQTVLWLGVVIAIWAAIAVFLKANDVFDPF